MANLNPAEPEFAAGDRVRLKPQLNFHPELAGPWTPALERRHSRLATQWREAALEYQVESVEPGWLTVYNERERFTACTFEFEKV